MYATAVAPMAVIPWLCVLVSILPSMAEGSVVFQENQASFYGQGSQGDGASFRDETSRALGTVTMDYTASFDNRGDPAVPPDRWHAIDIADSIRSTVTATEVSLRQLGSYQFLSPVGQERNNSLGFSHRFAVTFVVESVPVTVELFHSATDFGLFGDSAVELSNADTGALHRCCGGRRARAAAAVSGVCPGAAGASAIARSLAGLEVVSGIVSGSQGRRNGSNKSLVPGLRRAEFRATA